MKKLAILLPLLAIAPLVAARAEDPATNAPVLPAWFADVRVGMSTNEFFARLPDAKWTCEDEGPTPWLVEWEDESAPDVEAGFIFVRGRLAFLLASGDQDASGRFAAWSSELESRFGPPDVRDAVPMLHDIGVRTAWTNGPAVSALLLHAGGMPGADLWMFASTSRDFLLSGSDDTPETSFFLGLAPVRLSETSQRTVLFESHLHVRDLFHEGRYEEARGVARAALAAVPGETAVPPDGSLDDAILTLRLFALDCDVMLFDETGLEKDLEPFRVECDSPWPLSYRAFFLDRSDRPAEAEKLLRESCVTESESKMEAASGHVELAWSLLLQGKPDEAEANARAALAKAPSHPGAWDVLGASLRRKGDLAGAREAAEKALAGSFTDPVRVAELKIDYALVLDAQGETNRVRELIAEILPAPRGLAKWAARDLEALAAKHPAAPAPHADSAEGAKKPAP